MNPEEIIKKHVAGDQSVEESILTAASVISAKRTKDLVEANTMLARTAQASAEERVKSNEISADRLAKTTQESAELLAKTTQASVDQRLKSNEMSAELLAKATQASAELLAKTTQESAEQLRKNNAVSVKSMEWLTIAVVLVGLVQILIGAITLFFIIGNK